MKPYATTQNLPKMKYMGTHLINRKEINFCFDPSPVRKYSTQESQLSQLSALEKQGNVSLPNTRKTILQLDEIAPFRLNNSFTMGWYDLIEGERPRSPMMMFTDIIHLLSWYAPDVAKSYLIPFGKTLSQKMKKKKVLKFRFKNQSSMGRVEANFWNQIGHNLGSEFRSYDVNLAFADDLFCINEICNFYMEKVGFPLNLSEEQDSVFSSHLHATIILAMYDVCGNVEVRNLKVDAHLFPPMSDELIQKIEDNKFAFTLEKDMTETPH